MANSSISLYHTSWCPFCRRVVSAIKKLGIQIPIHDVDQDPVARQALVEATGRARVPVLRIVHDDGQIEWMPESRDIIDFLEKHFAPSPA